MSEKLREGLAAALLPYVSAWSGGTDLEWTAFYGMRIYSRGAKLYSHVDREHTHALSLIINVDQISMEEPWTLEIYDHDGNPNQVAIKPGELVYYESARCMHARPKPLAGKGFINMFVHFRPRDRPNWCALRPRPPPAPAAPSHLAPVPTRSLGKAPKPSANPRPKPHRSFTPPKPTPSPI